MSSKGLSFQDAVLRLQTYWAAQGCVIWQPHNQEVGAGTMNPATFLHVLGPEAWNVAYVEPSIRPDDARYGENPNRLGRHHQFQVILKPDPGDPQGLYLASLEAIGVDLARHDVRFVEDNWESPALGAWGLGWEVWLDGLEITQFTYFQQAGSLELSPNSVEITYGIDRILMALQDVQHFRDLRWNDRVTFGDILLGNEVQTSRYWFELADVGRLRQMYDLCEAEAALALEHGLVRPAHDYVLKCSHLFNVLDARGTVGVTERAQFFGRMRRLARQVAEAYMAERAEAGLPLGADADARHWVAGAPVGGAPEAPPADPGAAPEDPADFVLELGVEELPVDDLDAALASLDARMPALLAELRLAHGGVKVGGTPRRLVVGVSALAPRQADLVEEVVGPPLKAAYDAAGQPTKAAEGFAKSAGVTLAELRQVEQKGEPRLLATRHVAGRGAAEVLAEALPALIAALPAARAMRWNASGATFSRPLRWLLALHGSQLVPLNWAGLTADRVTRGPRPQSRPMAVATAEDHRKLLFSQGIEVDPEARREQIARQVARLAAEVGGTVPEDGALLAEVANLVEQPRALRGDFEPAFLDLPDPLLITVMKKHQRYFPVLGPDGRLLPHFITVANGAALDDDAVRYGNAAVIRARFADAAYFWRKDGERSLESFGAGLGGLSFQEKLGSMADKAARLVRLAPRLAAWLGADAAVTTRAAALAKNDLCTSMVVDFTSLQGVMGRAYALRSGEPEAVAMAIEEQYLPRGAGDRLPQSLPGTALALADRLDSLVGLFAAGLRPKGANDPFALRRAALGIGTILVEKGLDMDLPAAIDAAAEQLPLPLTPEVRAELIDFIGKRLEGQLREAGHAADVVAAVLAVQAARPAAAARAVRQLEATIAADGWEATLTAYARCARIVRSQGPVADTVDSAALVDSADTTLLAAVDAAAAGLDGGDAAAVLATLARLAPAVNAFFDGVLVMAEDPGLRAARLALVGRVAGLPRQVADLSLLEGF